MELQDEQYIAAPRPQVFDALQDPDILRQCIPGCEELTKNSDTEMAATVTMRVGPIKAKFNGLVKLSNLHPPEGYSISGEGSGGSAGFAKGGADVTLIEDGASTILRYKVKVDVGGKLAALGGRLMEGVAKKMSSEFFGKFAALVMAKGAEPAAVASHVAPDVTPAPNMAVDPPARTYLYVAAGIIALAAVALWFVMG